MKHFKNLKLNQYMIKTKKEAIYVNKSTNQQLKQNNGINSKTYFDQRSKTYQKPTQIFVNNKKNKNSLCGKDLNIFWRIVN